MIKSDCVAVLLEAFTREELSVQHAFERVDAITVNRSEGPVVHPVQFGILIRKLRNGEPL
jgi:hypothetical protein